MSGTSPLPAHLTTLPVELLLRVYEVLPSFADAVNLRATCHTLLDMWTDYRTTIVNAIVTNQIECYPHARLLLAAQPNGTPLDQEELSNDDLSKLIGNARHVETVIVDIEKTVIPGLKGTHYPRAATHSHNKTV